VVVLGTLRDVVRSLGTATTVTRERSNGVTTSDEGTAIPKPVSLKNLGRRVVHPISGRDRNLMPEGIRNRAMWVTYTDDYVRTSEEHGQEADVMIIKMPRETNAGRYVVETAENWFDANGCWRVFISREPGS
jgi:hypothetical protein